MREHKRTRYLVYCSDCDLGFDTVREMLEHMMLPSHEANAAKAYKGLLGLTPFEDTFNEDPETT